MKMSNESIKKRKRCFSEAWLIDDRYKSWIREVSSDNTLYTALHMHLHCICNTNLSCNSTYVSRHVDSVGHRNNI